MEPLTNDGLRPLEPLARALSRAVPERPRDDGLFGPRSVVWRLHRDRCLPITGIRSLMLQALHPLAMAGVAQHSDWKRDPAGRMAATNEYVLTVTYGECAAAEATAARVRAIHTHVRGVDDVTGLPYRADDPALLLWVHAALVDSMLVVAERYGRPLRPGDADRYVAEMVPFVAILGVAPEDVPASTADLAAYLASVYAPPLTPGGSGGASRPPAGLLQATPAARESMDRILKGPGLDKEDDLPPLTPRGQRGGDDLRTTWRELGQAAIGTLPEWARGLYGYPTPPPEALERETVRQLLGVFDLAYESLPGVLEARQRIELRMRG
jgi:hypothetical protein